MSNRAFFAGKWAAQEARKIQSSGQVYADAPAASAVVVGAPGPLDPIAPSGAVATTRPTRTPDWGDPIPALARAYGLPDPRSEYRFAQGRRWRFDHAWVAERVALEIEGGVWTNGRHTRGSGFMRDVIKYNEAAVLGWRVIRCTPSTLADGMATVRRAIDAN